MKKLVTASCSMILILGSAQSAQAHLIPLRLDNPTTYTFPLVKSAEIATPLDAEELWQSPKALMASALIEIDSAFTGTKASTLKVKYVLSPDANKKVVNAIKPKFAKGLRFFSGQMPQQGVLTIIAFGSKSISWAQKKLNAALVGSGIKHKVTECFGGFEWSFEKDGKWHHVWLACTTDRFAMQGTPTSAHPATHFYQGTLKSHRMPAWLVEGPATLFGDVLGYGSKDKRSTKNNWGGQTALKNVLKTGNPEKVIPVIKKLEGQNERGMGNVYTLGKMMSAGLIGAYGIEKYFAFNELFATSDDYQANFLETYGITTEEIYEKLVPVLKDWATRY